MRGLPIQIKPGYAHSEFPAKPPAEPAEDLQNDPETHLIDPEYEHSGSPSRLYLSAPESFRNDCRYLREYQQNAAYTLRLALSQTDVKMVLDGSDTGMGKSWVACEVLKRIRKPFAIVCPKKVVNKWNSIIEENFPELLHLFQFIESYETLRRGNSKYLKRRKIGRGNRLEWVNPPHFIVFDEVHWCKSGKSLNSKMLVSAIQDQRIKKILGLSATVANSPLDMRATGYGLGLHNLDDYFPWWCLKMGCYKGPFKGLVFDTGDPSNDFPTESQIKARNALKKIHNHIYPIRGTRIKKTNDNTKNRIIPELVSVDWKHKKCLPYIEEINQAEIQDELRAEEKENEISHLVVNIRDRQRAEIAKVPAIVEKTVHLLEQGNSVAIFVNYIATIDFLDKEFEEYYRSFIEGTMSTEEREKSIKDFQSNHSRLIVCQNSAAGESIDLDDIRGTHPRCTIISPGYSPMQLLQILGRCYRPATTASAVIQWILFAEKTIEERVCKIVNSKLHDLSTLTDGDFKGAIKLRN